MQHRILGRGAPPVPVIGLGTVDEAEAILRVRGAIDSGVTLVDTAQAYGPSEALVGRALRDGYRERCFLATKVSVGNLAHSPLAKGLLTGRYAPGHVFPGDDERSKSPRFQGDLFARSCAVAARLGEVAAAKGITLVQMAIAWCLRQPAVSCVLVGAKSLEQVREHVGAAEVSLDDDELDRTDAILREAP